MKFTTFYTNDHFYAWKFSKAQSDKIENKNKNKILNGAKFDFDYITIVNNHELYIILKKNKYDKVLDLTAN